MVLFWPDAPSQRWVGLAGGARRMRNTANGAVLARCSQPEVGWLGWRSSEDEELVRAVAEACAYDSGTNTRHSSGSDISSGSYDTASHPGEIPSLKDLSAEAAAR